ncbi:MAG: hypothetical protein IPN33_17660 [Saprospiraceae bacterium]|nr:hypothetical protein [Saprospiraceae bacterium]
MRSTLIFAALTILSLASCSRAYYQTGDYDYFANRHQTIAILPVQTITYGRLRERPSEEQMKIIEEAESRAFQMSLYAELAKRSGVEYNDIAINIQHYSQTNSKLEEAGIGIRESWDLPPERLAAILGVDAVVHTTVEKEYFLTELESFGLGLATTLAIFFSNNPWWIFLPDNRTSEVRSTCAILDGHEGVTVWATDRSEATYWNRSHRDVIENITRSLARRFPYRNQ